MTTETAALAVLLRRTQWLLDDLAYEVGAGRMNEVELVDAAVTLDELSQLLRANAPRRQPLD